MSKSTIKRKVAELEEKTGTAPEEWQEFIMSLLEPCGIFCHAHYRFTKTPKFQQKIEACTDDEEIKLMRESYEEDKHSGFLDGRGITDFVSYLEYYLYMTPDELQERARAAIEKVRTEESK